MRTFSERFGYKPVQEALQVESMSTALRNSLWNVLQVVWKSEGFMFHQHARPYIDEFSSMLWGIYFKEPVDTRPNYHGSLDAERTMRHIRDYFFSCEWHEVYSFVEFVVNFTRRQFPKLPEMFNMVLETEVAGYRFIGTQVTPITDQIEIDALKEAIGDSRFGGVDQHLARSLELLSDRISPDYRNSIKEAISAVEAMARHITGNSRATLGDALNTLGKQGKLHPALRSGFSSLYGYASDEGGIRHAMLDEPDLTQADAKYFLISCSSFVNYLKASLP